MHFEGFIIWENLASFFGSKFYLVVIICFVLDNGLCYLSGMSPRLPLRNGISYLFEP